MDCDRILLESAAWTAIPSPEQLCSVGRNLLGATTARRIDASFGGATISRVDLEDLLSAVIETMPAIFADRWIANWRRPSSHLEHRSVRVLVSMQFQGGSTMRGARTGDRVRNEVSRGPLDAGSAQQRCSEIIKFTIGSGEIIAGVNRSVIGLVPGEPKRHASLPKAGYGSARCGLINEVSRSRFPRGTKLRIGQRSRQSVACHAPPFHADSGEEAPTVVVDNDNPLANYSIFLAPGGHVRRAAWPLSILWRTIATNGRRRLPRPNDSPVLRIFSAHSSISGFRRPADTSRGTNDSAHPRLLRGHWRRRLTCTTNRLLLPPGFHG